MAENTSNNASDLSIREQVKNVIVEVLGVKPEQVTDEASFKDDLGASKTTESSLKA